MGCGASKTEASISHNVVHPVKTVEKNNITNQERTISKSVKSDRDNENKPAAASKDQSANIPYGDTAESNAKTEETVTCKSEESEEDPNFVGGQTTSEFREDAKQAHNKFRYC